MKREPSLGARPNDGAAVFNVQVTPSVWCEVHVPHVNEARLPLWHAHLACCDCSCAALAGRAGRGVAFRGEEGKKAINALEYWQRGGDEGQPTACRTYVHKTHVNTFCCHGNRIMQLIIPHLVYISIWNERDPGKGSSRLGVEKVNFDFL